MGREHFDAKAGTWDEDPARVIRAGQVAAAIAATVVIDPRTRVLEYGAGTGLVSQMLQHLCGPITLVDNSDGMREVMRSKVDAGAFREARVADLDLEREDPPQECFDLIVSSMVLHHVADLTRVLAGFAALLEPGGQLALADLDREDGSFHDDGFDGHHGFGRTQLGEDLVAAGFRGVQISDCTEVVKQGRPYTVFLAQAQR